MLLEVAGEILRVRKSGAEGDVHGGQLRAHQQPVGNRQAQACEEPLEGDASILPEDAGEMAAVSAAERSSLKCFSM